MWSFTRGSDYRDLTGKILVFWISGRLWEVVANTRGSCTWKFDCITIKYQDTIDLCMARHKKNGVGKNIS